MPGARRSWFGRLWDRLFRRRPRVAPGGIPEAPLTLVARVSDVEQARENQMLRLAEESIRRGHPEQAAIVYRKAVERYRAEGKTPKEQAILNLWAKIAPHDPEVWTALATIHEKAGRTRPALEALSRAAALWRQVGKDDDADRLESQMRQLRAHGASPQAAPGRPGLSVTPRVHQPTAEPEPEPEPEAEPEPPPPPPPVVQSPLMISAADIDADGPLELELPESNTFDALDDEAEALLETAPPPGVRPVTLPGGHAEPPLADDAFDDFDDFDDDEPERLPTGAMTGLEDDEPEPLSASALEVVEEPPGRIEDSETEPGPTYDRTIAAVSAEELLDRPTDDEISPELMAELTAMANEDEDETGEEAAATIAMPAITAEQKRAFGIPDAATVMDPGGLPSPSVHTVHDQDDDDDDEYEDDDDEDEDNRTRGYSADELAQLDELLKKKGLR